MTTRTVTITILLAVVAVLIGWDVYTLIAVPDGTATISQVTFSSAVQHPIIPFALGVVCGHLFWPQHPPKEKP